MKCSVHDRVGSEMQALSLLTFRGPPGCLLKSYPFHLPHGRQSRLFAIDLQSANILISLTSLKSRLGPVP